MTDRDAPEHLLDALFARLERVRQAVLMLDYDGTLAPFRPNAVDAHPYPEVTHALDSIMDAGHTRVVIVSGRWAKELIPLLGLKHRPELWGSHGWERVRVDRRYDAARVPAGTRTLLLALESWSGAVEALGGRVERKPAGVAFHWRGLSRPDVAAIRDELSQRWANLSRPTQLEWHEFDGGVELRAIGRDKGDVVRSIAAEAGADAALAYLGDDLTDEDAFEAMPAGGASILVRAEYRPTAADTWIRPPDGLVKFLARWNREAGGREVEVRRHAD